MPFKAYRAKKPVSRFIRLHPDIDEIVRDYASRELRGLSNAIGKLILEGHEYVQLKNKVAEEAVEREISNKLESVVQEGD